jgi:hypothetical protein
MKCTKDFGNALHLAGTIPLTTEPIEKSPFSYRTQTRRLAGW